MHHSTPNDNPSCPLDQFHSGRCIYYQYRPSLSGSSRYLLTDTDFLECEVYGDESYGGAVDCLEGDLTVQRCSFVKCYSEYRAGALSFQSNGMCVQEDNCFYHCSSGAWGGAFDSYDSTKLSQHNQRQCRFFNNHSPYYAHFCIEFSPMITVDSNIYIHGRSDGADYGGTVVNYHSHGPTVYYNCLFADGKASYTGALSFLAFTTHYDVSFIVKFCFFRNNFGIDNTVREIYFDQYMGIKADQSNIMHCISATPNSRVYVQNQSQKDKDWLLQTNNHERLTGMRR